MTFTRIIRTSRPITGVRIADSSHKTSADVIHTETTEVLSDAERTAAEEARAIAEANLAAQGKTHQLVETLLETIDELEKRRSQSFSELQMAAVEIAVMVGSKIAYDKIQTDDYPVEALVNTALEKLDPQAPVTIRLHPQDQEMLNEHVDGDDINNVIQTVKFEADATLERGSCRADTADFSLVTTIEQRTNEIRELLLQGIGDAQIERRANGASARSVRRFPDRRETA